MGNAKSIIPTYTTNLLTDAATSQKWSLCQCAIVCPRKLSLVPLTLLCKFLPLDRIAMQQLSLQLRNTLLIVIKPF